MAWASQSRGPRHHRSVAAGMSYVVFAPEDSKSQNQKFFSKGLLIWGIKMQITKKNTGTPMFMGYGKRIFKKVNICITDSLGYTPEVNTS